MIFRRKKKYIYTKIDEGLRKSLLAKLKQLLVSNLDTILKITSSLIAVAGFFIGIWEFSIQQRNSKRIDFERQLYIRQMDIYQKTCTAVGNLLSSVGSSGIRKRQYDSSVNVFMSLYWGEIKFVADSNVIEKLDGLREEINHFSIDSVNDKALEGLKIAGEDLVHSCQISAQQSIEKLDLK